MLCCYVAGEHTLCINTSFSFSWNKLKGTSVNSTKKMKGLVFLLQMDNTSSICRHTPKHNPCLNSSPLNRSLYLTLEKFPFQASTNQEVIRMEENRGENSCLEQISSPHEAIFFVLTYLPLYELLAMSQACRSLRDVINKDILPWMQLLVDRPLNFRISDDILVKTVSKAKGRLQVLALINCVKITDEGLLRVVEQNSCISKLHVPSCTSLSAEGIITVVKFLTQTNPNLNSLRINGIYGIKKQELKTLQELINPNVKLQSYQSKIFYHEKLPTLLHQETNHSIDVEVCPICDEVRMVFDCPGVCGKKCRGCDVCIPRCKECGVCFNSLDELEEAACVDSLCLDCWLKLPKCSFCNKPYCNEHAALQLRLAGSEGFVCDSCHSNHIL